MQTMRHQADSWLIGDWVVLGAHVPRWAIIIAGLVVVALLVAWFERHKPARLLRRAAIDYDASALPER